MNSTTPTPGVSAIPVSNLWIYTVVSVCGLLLLFSCVALIKLLIEQSNLKKMSIEYETLN